MVKLLLSVQHMFDNDVVAESLSAEDRYEHEIRQSAALIKLTTEIMNNDGNIESEVKFVVDRLIAKVPLLML